MSANQRSDARLSQIGIITANITSVPVQFRKPLANATMPKKPQPPPSEPPNYAGKDRHGIKQEYRRSINKTSGGPLSLDQKRTLNRIWRQYGFPPDPIDVVVPSATSTHKKRREVEQQPERASVEDLDVSHDQSDKHATTALVRGGISMMCMSMTRDMTDHAWMPTFDATLYGVAGLGSTHPCTSHGRRIWRSSE